MPRCTYRGCKSDWRTDKSIKFVPFPKPWIDVKRTKYWIKLCGRAYTFDKVNNNTFVCEKHFDCQDDLDPKYNKTLEPIPFDSCESEVLREEPEADENAVVVGARIKTYSRPERIVRVAVPVPHQVSLPQSTNIDCDPSVPSGSTQKPSMVSVATQVDLTNGALPPLAKIRPKSSKAEGKAKAPIKEFVLQTEKRAFFFTGLKKHERECLWNFLGDAKLRLEILDRTPKTLSCNLKSLSIECQFLLLLIVLRRNKTFLEISVTFFISPQLVSQVFRTWIQFVYCKFQDVKSDMFIKKKDIPRPLPRHFNNKLLRDVRVIIDGTELKVQSSTDFKQQGNMYSSYKSHTTAKILIGVTPSGMGSFVSDCYEGSISDRQIVEKSGFLDYLEKDDVVLADRGFNIEDLVREKDAKLIVPPFLKGRSAFTFEETQQTKIIAKARIHIERYNWRFKKFEFLKGVIPYYHLPYLSQAVFVCCCLANFSKPLAT